ncbi:MAG: quinolinate synthase NadA [Deltaproteobacteria bacterium]|nr:quinolinate synthase NadA [Candidatus Zymogenaceae bacterium]
METTRLHEEIRELARKKNAVLLAHNYTVSEVQDVSDFVGDSLGLSIQASETDADIIVFSGVHFMAESAAILSPKKKVLIPKLDAGCPMADMITSEDARTFKERYPGAELVMYINSSAAAKAECDICCTSANAIRVVGATKSDMVLMAPDRNLAQYTARFTDREIVFWDGYCIVHEQLTPEDVQKARDAHPDAELLVHPECRPEVIDMADQVASTSGMLKYVKESSHHTFLIGTEIGILHPLRCASPEKNIYPVSEKMVCVNMKKTSLADIRDCLKGEKNRVVVPEDVAKGAKIALDRMIAIKKDD